MGIKKRASALWYSELSLHQLGSRPTVFIPRWATHPCILYQVCATRGATEPVQGECRCDYEHETLFKANKAMNDSGGVYKRSNSFALILKFDVNI